MADPYDAATPLDSDLAAGAAAELRALKTRLNGHTVEQASIQFKDEGANIGTTGQITSVNITGAGATASVVGAALTINIPGVGAGSQAAIQFKDDGTNRGASGAVTDVDFTGTGVTATIVGTVLTVNIPTPTFTDKVKAYGTWNATPTAIGTPFNVASATKTATGKYTIAFTSFITDPAGSVAVLGTAGTPTSICVEFLDGSQIKIITCDMAGTLMDAQFSIVICGN